MWRSYASCIFFNYISTHATFMSINQRHVYYFENPNDSYTFWTVVPWGTMTNGSAKYWQLLFSLFPFQILALPVGLQPHSACFSPPPQLAPSIYQLAPSCSPSLLALSLSQLAPSLFQLALKPSFVTVIVPLDFSCICRNQVVRMRKSMFWTPVVEDRGLQETLGAPALVFVYFVYMHM